MKISASLSAPGASLAGALAIYGGFVVPNPDMRGSGFLCLALGSAAFTLVGLLHPVDQEHASCPPSHSALECRPSIALRSGLLASAASNAAALVIWARSGDPNLAWALYAASLAALLATAWAVAGRPRPSLGLPRGELWLILALVGLAAGLRFHDLAQQPFGLFEDEAFHLLRIKRVIADPGYRPVYSFNLPTLFWYFTLPFVPVDGLTPLAMRSCAAVGGTLGVLAVYLLARELGGRRYAFVAAALLAPMAWHLNFSRIGFNATWSVALDALAAYFFLRAVRRASVAEGLVGGVCLGLGLQMYYISRLLPVILAVYLLHHLVLGPPGLWRRARAALAAFGAAAGLAVSPLALFAALRPADFFSHTSQVSVFHRPEAAGLAPLYTNLGKYLLMFNAAGDQNGRHNLPGAPMLDPLTGALFVVGLAYCLPRLGRPTSFLMFIWVPLMLIPGLLSDGAPHGLRTLDEVTAVALLAALPIADLWARWQALLAPSAARLAAPLMTALVLLGLCWIGSFNLDRYFNLMRRSPAVVEAFSAAQTIIGREASALPAGTRIFIDGAYVNGVTLEFLAPRLGVRRAFDFAQQIPFREGGDVVVFLSPEAAGTAADLQRVYPQAEVAERRAPDVAEPLLYAVHIPARAIKAAAGRPTAAD